MARGDLKIRFDEKTIDSIDKLTLALERHTDLKGLLNKARIEAIGWTWAEACVQLDNGNDPRQYEQGQLIEQATKDLGEL